MTETGVAIDVINTFTWRDARSGATFIDVSCAVNVCEAFVTSTRVRDKLINADTIDTWIRVALISVCSTLCTSVASIARARIRIDAVRTGTVHTGTRVTLVNTRRAVRTTVAFETLTAV